MGMEGAVTFSGLENWGTEGWEHPEAALADDSGTG